jgi:cytochrome b subunit of formate dehydrogenase
MIQTTRPEEGAPGLSSAPLTSSSQGANLEKTFKGWIVLWSSFAFAVLQSICTAFVAISGLRVVIGLTSLASALGARVPWRLHADWIRIPMVLLALTGALINLYAIWRIRRLRQRPASQWRMKPVSTAKLRSENLQILLAVATLALLFVEEVLHLILHHVV